MFFSNISSQTTISSPVDDFTTVRSFERIWVIFFNLFSVKLPMLLSYYCVVQGMQQFSSNILWKFLNTIEVVKWERSISKISTLLNFETLISSSDFHFVFDIRFLVIIIISLLRGGPIFAPEKCLKEFILTWSTSFENPILLRTISLRYLWSRVQFRFCSTIRSKNLEQNRKFELLKSGAKSDSDTWS